MTRSKSRMMRVDPELQEVADAISEKQGVSQVDATRMIARRIKEKPRDWSVF